MPRIQSNGLFSALQAMAHQRTKNTSPAAANAPRQTSLGRDSAAITKENAVQRSMAQDSSFRNTSDLTHGRNMTLPNQSVINGQAVQRTLYGEEHAAPLVAQELSTASHSVMKAADAAQDFLETGSAWVEKKELLEDLTHSVSGEYVWPFSQSSPTILKARCADVDTSDGICAALAAMWIERNARGDSLENFLKKGSVTDLSQDARIYEPPARLRKKFFAAVDARKEKNIRENEEIGTGKVDLNKIRYAMQLFILSTKYPPDVMIQKNLWADRYQDVLKNLSVKERQIVFEREQTRLQDRDQKLRPKFGGREQRASLANWLAGKNLKKLALNSVVAQQQGAESDIREIYNAPKKLKRGDMTALAYAQQMASAIVEGTAPNKAGHAIYQCIDIHGDDSGHMMAAAVSHNGKVAFFDPNFGEFNFKSKGDFVRWWPEFLDVTKYSNHLNKEYEIISFASRN